MTASQSTCAVVGIGASAGGLDALRRLLGALPDNPPFAVVVVQHLDPSTRSQLAEIMDRACNLPVVRAKSGEALVAGTVYVVPEGREARLEDGRLRLKAKSKTCNDPIDVLFTSLAGHSGASGCGVLLSGNGADGVLGLREIRGAGGIAFVQDPSTADYPGMPSSAIDAGVADFVGSPEQLANDLLAHVQHPGFGGKSVAKRATKAAAEREDKALARILGLVRIDSGMDFSGYKPTTVTRRISRRAMLRDASSLDEYRGILETDHEELRALVDDLLINVTQFFRDAEVFEALRHRVFQEMLQNKTDDDTIRVWVVGCSTGEEVYSVLITALEAMEDAKVHPKITVFGTDASEDAVKRARAGVYPVSICSAVSPERLTKYFVRTDAGFEIDRTLRDMCVFARQDVTKDTPFSRLDLVTLRNVLIYMEQPLQRQVLAVAHFALVPDGVLLLGTSETPETEPRLFRALDKQNHVYRRQDVASRLPVDVANSARAAIDVLSVASPAFAFDTDALDPHAAANEMALLVYAPPRVVVDVNGHILHFFGDTSPYLEHAAGKATLDIAEMAQPGLALELKEALEAAKAIDGRASRETTFVSAGGKRHVSIDVTPLPAPPGQTQLMVAFREFLRADAAVASPVTSEDLSRLYESREQRVRGELGALRGRLRAISEEKEQFNQSLRSANEEIRSSNEELQSINEELETAKEELQSANEELITVNDELRQSNRDLGLVNDDLTNFTGSIDVPVIMLDRSLRVRRFTPQAQRVVRIENTDAGRLLEHLRLRVNVADLPHIAAEVIETEKPRQLEVQDEDGRWYTMSARPYRSAEGRIDGVVIAFTDVDEIKRNAERFERRAGLSEALTAIDADVASTLHPDEIMQRALDQSADAVGADAAAIDWRDGDGWLVRYQHGFSAAEVGLHLAETDVPTVTAAARARETVAFADMAADEATYSGFVKNHSLRSAVAVPLILQGSLIAVVVFYRRGVAKAFSAEDVEFVRRLGVSISLALENSRRMQVETAATRRAETLNAINEIIRSAITPNDLLARLVDEVSQAAGADKCLVLAVQGDRYTITHVRDVDTDLVGVEKPADFYPAFASAARKRTPVLIGDTWTDSLTNKDFVVPNNLRAFQLLPLTVDKVVVGVLALAFGEPRTFDADDTAFSMRLCTAMSVALKNALLYESEVRAQEEANRELETSNLLLEAAETFATELDLERVFDILTDLTQRVTGRSGVFIDFFDQEARVLTIMRSARPNLAAGTRFPIDALAPDLVRSIDERRPYVLDYTDPELPDRYKGNSQEFNVFHLLCVPLVVGDRTIGAMMVDEPNDERPFAPREIDVIEGIAREAALAIENARLFEAEVAAQQLATRELNTANTLLEAANELNRWTDLPSLLDALVRLLLRLIPGGRVNIGIAADDRSSMTMAAGGGQRPYPTGAVVPWDRLTSGARTALETGRTSLVDFEHAEEGGIANEYGSRLALFVALKFADRIVGQIGVDVPDERYDFTPRMIALIEGVASQAAVAIDNARLYESEQEARGAEAIRAERMALLRDIAEIGSASFSLAEAGSRLLETIATGLGTVTAYVFVLDEDGKRIIPLALAGVTPEYIETHFGPIEIDGDGTSAKVFRNKQPVFIRDAETDPFLSDAGRAFTLSLGQHSGASLPLMVRGESLGVLSLAWAEPRDLDDDDVGFLESVASEAVLGLQSARLFEAEGRARQRATRELDLSDALLGASKALVGAIELNQVMGVIVDAVVGSTRHSRVTVSLWSQEGVEVEVVASRGAGALAPGQRFCLDAISAPAREVLATGSSATFDIEGLKEGERGTGDEVDARVGLIVPLVYQDRVLGLIGVDEPSERRAFDEREISLIEGLAAQAAVATERARLFEAEQTELARTTILREVASAAASTINTRELSERVLAACRDQLGARAGTVYLFDRDAGDLAATALLGFPKKVLPQMERMELDEARAAARSYIYNEIVMHDMHGLPEGITERAKAVHAMADRWVSLPVRARGELVGSFGLIFPGQRAFSADELALYQALADQMGVGLDNARLFEAEQVEVARTTLLREIATAAASSVDASDLSERALAACRERLGIKAGNVYTIDREEGALVAAALTGFPSEVVQQYRRMELDEGGPSARSYLRGEVVTHQSPDLTDGTKERAESARVLEDRWVTVPIRAREELVGSLGLVFSGQRSFSADEIALYQTVADQLGIGLDNARLFEAEVEAQRQAKVELETTSQLLAAAHAMAGWLDLTDVLGQLAKSVHVATGRRRVFVHRWDEQHPALVLTALAGEGGAPLGTRYEWDKIAAPSKEVLTEKRAKILDYDEVSEPAEKPYAGTMDFRVALAVPLVERSTLIGLLIVDDPGERHEFEPREVELIEGIAAQASAALRTARLFEAEHAAREQVEALQRIAEFSTSSLELVEVIDRSAAYLVEHLGVDVITYWSLDEQRERLFPVTGVGFPLEFFDGFSAGVGLDQPFEIAHAVHELRPIVRPSSAIELVPEPVRASYEKFGVPLGALLVLPVRGGSHALGAITFAWREQRELTEDDVAFFASAVDEIAIGAENAALFAEVRESARLDEALNAIDANIHSTLDFEEIMKRSLSEGADALGCDASAVEMREGSGWQVRYQFGFKTESVGRLLTDAEAPCAVKVMQTRRPFVVQDATCDDAMNVGSIAQEGLRSAIAVPLIVRDEVTGCLLFYMRDRVRAFRDIEIDFAVKLAASVALASENAELFQSEQLELGRTRLLQAVATAAASSLGLGEICELTLDEVRSMPEIAAASVYVLEEGRNALRCLALFGYPDDMKLLLSEVPIDDSNNPGRVVAHDLELLTHEDPGNSPQSVQRLARIGIPDARWIVVPLKSAGRLLGTLGLIFRGERSFDPQEIGLFCGIADTLASSLANARLYQGELEAQRQVQRELETTGLLLETATTLSTWSDVDGALERLGDILLQSTEHERVTLNLWDEDSRELRTVVSVGKASMSPATFPESVLSAQIKEVIASRKTIVFDYDKLPKGHTAKLAADRVIHLGLVIPIVYQKRVLGLIGIDSPGERRDFSPREIERLEAVASQAAIAIENARLFAAEQAELARTTVLKEIAAIGSSSITVHDLARRALETTHRLLGTTTGNFFVVDEESRVLRSIATFGIPDEAVVLYREVSLDAETASTRVALTGEIATHADVDIPGYTERTARVTGKAESGWIILPVAVRGKIVGTLGLSVEAARPFGSDEVELYESIAELLGVALERAILFSDLEESRRQVTQVLQSISDGFYALDRAWRFTYANAEAARMIGVPQEQLMGRTIGEAVGNPDVQKVQEEQFDPAMNHGQVVEFERYFTQTDIWAEIRVYPSEEGVAVYGRDISERMVAEEALRSARERADFMATLLDESVQPFGVGNFDGSMGLVNAAFERLTGYTAEELADISWATTLTPPEYADAESKMLEQLIESREPVRYEKEYIRKDGTRIPVEMLVHLDVDASGTPRHYYAFVTDLSERKESERLDTAFNEIRTLVGGTLEYSEILETALREGAKALGADAATVLAEDSRGWSTRASIAMPKVAIGEHMSDADALVAPIVVGTGAHVAIADATADKRLSASRVRRLRVKSALAAPLGLQGAELGVLAFYYRKKPAEFSTAQEAFVVRLARVVSLAIQNSMLYERERKIADTLQEALLSPPEAIQGIKTSYLYRPASASANVGGDFYDVFALEDGRVAIIVGDVSGKGIEAARLTSLIHDGIRAYALETPDPVELLGRLNRLVCQLSPPEQFATLFLGVLDPENGRLRYCTAGHPSPAVVGRERVSYLLSTGSPIMGGFAKAPFHSFDTVLAVGERLVLFTDGVTEARRGSRFLGEDGLLKLLGKMTHTPGAKLPQRLLDQVLGYAEGHLRDDTVILCVERTSEAGTRPAAKS